jgi:hypothetical protein
MKRAQRAKKTRKAVGPAVAKAAALDGPTLTRYRGISQ